MKDFINGMAVSCILFSVIMVVTVNVQIHYEKKKPIEPIVINCPTGEKQIVIPDARKMEL